MYISRIINYILGISRIRDTIGRTYQYLVEHLQLNHINLRSHIYLFHNACLFDDHFLSITNIYTLNRSLHFDTLQIIELYRRPFFTNIHDASYLPIDRK